MIKVVFRFCLFLLPILLIYGLLRKLIWGADPSVPFLPSYPSLVAGLSNMPDFLDLAKEDIRMLTWFVDEGVTIVTGAFDEITDIPSFFSAIGEFFTGIWSFLEVVGRIFVLIWHFMEIPVRFLVWFVSVLNVRDPSELVSTASSVGV